MRKLFFLAGTLCLIYLTGCNTATPTPEPTAVPTKTAEPAPTPEPVVEPTELVDYCVSCHTDKEQLISTAKPVLETESESSGVG